MMTCGDWKGVLIGPRSSSTCLVINSMAEPDGSYAFATVESEIRVESRYHRQDLTDIERGTDKLSLVWC